MSDKTEDNKFHLNASFDSKHILNNNPKDFGGDLRESRLSSAASKKNQEQISNSIDHFRVDQFSNETQRRSPVLSQYESNQLNNDKPSKNSADISADDENGDDFPIKGRNSYHLNDHHNSSSIMLNEQEDSNSKTFEKLQIDNSNETHRYCQYSTEVEAPSGTIDETVLDRIQGSIIGMALGDALGAHVEFRPHAYMKANPVTELTGGGTWGLLTGQFTDDTSMALCLANSLLARRDFIPYDQLVRYKWWYKFGYMSSTGHCFDIGAATSQSLHEFERRQKKFANEKNIPYQQIDKLSDFNILDEFDPYCSENDVAGNGALMRLAPVPLFFFRNKYAAIEFSGRSGQITHGDKQAYDACRLYGALIVAALHGFTKKQILAKNFYSKHRHWFGEEPLHEEIEKIAKGSYKRKRGYNGGIRGKGFIVKALEAALWAFWSDDGSFEKGALAAVNLGDDTDTTAAIYGQLAGAYYGYEKLPEHWKKHVYAHEFLKTLGQWITYEGQQWELEMKNSSTNK
ncbi:unnamed protein product [Rotaria magnacalcarata]|uniref:ADP-ribosylarginine hydrolase n=1 Tax=Rotaria magnacalcarata TaxID=392030 RepID=A0A820C3P1_9BILA|nr:unnamed protein product [Rotaria magnacalcarata]CAF4217444.1 unnamed protein product [Rotaria magnacalcarata]